MRDGFHAALAVALLACAPALAFAQEHPRTERIQFARDAQGATLKGQIRGDESIDYLLAAKAGQSLTVTLESLSSPTSYFDVTAPGADSALFVGSTSGNTFSGKLPSDGDYTIRVYQMRSAERRNGTAVYE